MPYTNMVQTTSPFVPLLVPGIDHIASCTGLIAMVLALPIPASHVRRIAVPRYRVPSRRGTARDYVLPAAVPAVPLAGPAAPHWAPLAPPWPRLPHYGGQGPWGDRHHGTPTTNYHSVSQNSFVDATRPGLLF